MRAAPYIKKGQEEVEIASMLKESRFSGCQKGKCSRQKKRIYQVEVKLSMCALNDLLQDVVITSVEVLVVGIYLSAPLLSPDT